jgi:drug/metabolite transporter (DMT)-like permease
LIKAGLTADSPLSAFLVFRYGVLALLLSFMLPALLGKIRNVGPVLVIGYGALVALQAVFQTVALNTRAVTSSWYCLSFATSPVLTLILLRVRWTVRLTVSALCALGGTLCFADMTTLGSPESLLGVSALAVSTAAWSVSTAMLPRLLTPEGERPALSKMELMTLSVWAAALASLAVWIADGVPAYAPATVSFAALVGLVVLTPLAFVLFLQAIHLLPRFAVVVQYLELGVGALVGVLLLDEPFAMPQAAGLALVVAGLLVLPAPAKEPDLETEGSSLPEVEDDGRLQPELQKSC